MICLERRLAKLGYPVDVKALYGTTTVEAVNDQKRRAGLPQDGIAGAELLDFTFSSKRNPVDTWANGCIFTTLRAGMRTHQIVCLEYRLAALGYEVDARPTIGVGTLRAVRHMQQRAGLDISGVAGRKTLDYMFGPRQPIRTWANNCITHDLEIGMRGPDVACMQRRLARLHLLDDVDGDFGPYTQFAVRVIERRAGYATDGVAGPDTLSRMFEASLPAQIRAGRDELGYRLSPVSVQGHRGPLPPSSGSGPRIVYSRAQQRTWAIASDGHVVRSWLVSGSLYDNERPGRHHVYSKSRWARAFTGAPIRLPYTIRYYETPRGNDIGFHAIPIREDGSRIMSVYELGVPRSAGCTRQSDRDAWFLWNWAPVGTPVVVT